MTVNTTAKKSAKTKVKAQQKPVAVEPAPPVFWLRWHPYMAWAMAAIAAVSGFELWSSVTTINGGLAGFPIDDSWIHLTFARTLAETGRFAYGPHNPVTSGSTSPLFTFLEALLFLVSSNEFFIAKLLSVLGFAFTVYFVFRATQAARPEFPWLPVAAAALVLVSPRLYPATTWGMETTLAAAFIAAGAFYYERGLWLGLGITLGLSVWCRPDLVLVSLAIAIDYFAFPREKKVNWKLLLLPIILLFASYALFNYSLSGSLLPNTFAAKLAYYKANKEGFWESAWRFFTKNGQGFTMVLVVLGLIGAIVSIVRQRRSVPLYPFLIAVGFVALYSWKLPYLYQEGRYLVPDVTALTLCAVFGATLLSMTVKINQRRIAMMLPVILVAVAAAVEFNALESTEVAAGEAQLEAYIARLQVKSAKWCAQNLPKEAAIATHDIGAMGYYSGRKTIDIVGLVDPEIIPHIGDPVATVNFMRKRGATHAALLVNWFEIINENPSWVNAPRESERMIIYPVTDSTRLASATVLSIHQFIRQLIDQHSTDGLAQALQEAIRLDPNDALTYTLAGELMLQSGKRELAKQLLEQALKIFPNSIFARMDYGMAGGEVKP